MILGIFPLSNDILLFLVCCGLVVCLYLVHNPTEKVEEKKKRVRCFPSRARPLLAPPYYSGAAPRNALHMDILSLNRYIPKNVLITSVHEESTRNSVKRVIPKQQAKRTSISVTKTPESDGYTAICQKIMFPFTPGCEPDSLNAIELHKAFPQLSRPDIVRFLVARKGNMKAAEEMIVKWQAWRDAKFPLKRSEVRNAFLTKCFFPYGRARDGSPVVYMRGGLYDSNKATPEQFAMAAAYTIDWSLRQYPGTDPL